MRQWWARGGRQMLQDLQYLVGTSIAAVVEEGERTVVQDVVGGPRARGSVVGGVGGKGWRFRGRICRVVSADYAGWKG